MVYLVILIILIVVLCLFWFRDNSLKHNISALWSIAIIDVLLLAIVFFGSKLIKQLKSFGVGSLFTDAVSMGNPMRETEDGIVDGVLYIEVKQSDIVINGITYDEVSEVIPIIENAAGQGVEKAHIVDNYALMDTVVALEQALDNSNIEAGEPEESE